ncbi:helicase-associated domain-containing protein [Georgenia faecalis]|uniref:Helicase-associated domain-containing protein n=1 Tax=Georgenia faecalis TaxID=2483799 RepID=A0ABV9D6A4_9MICO|nr:helicase-associated domain-containing protein [Georgenia faecalis]
MNTGQRAAAHGTSGAGTAGTPFGTATSAATTEDLARALAERPDGALVELLRLRPDLAVPAASSITVLAARAASRPSVERVLARLDAAQLEVVEALAVLAAMPDGDPARLAALLQTTAAELAPLAEHLERLGLTVGGRAVLGVVEAIGPYPAGLGPSAGALPGEVAPPATSRALAKLMATAPPAAARMLEALTWGPPVGVVRAEDPSPAALWLLERGVLQRLSPTQLVLPLEVGLAARGDRIFAVRTAPPSTDTIPRRRLDVVAAEGARTAEDVVRLVTLLVTAWDEDPPPALRGGGLGARDLKRAATLVERDAAVAAAVAELAGAAGLVAPMDDGADGAVFAPTPAATDWRELPLGERWAQLALGWLRSRRTAWLVGTRNDRGALRAALEPGLERGWAATLRQRVVATLADLPEGSAPTPAQLHALLTWHAPRATPPLASVAAVLAEAELIGVIGAGALTAAGRAALGPGDDAEPHDDVMDPGATGQDDAARTAAVVAALLEALPEPVEELLIQGDLTGVVPGRPGPGLEELITLAADVESRGAALTVRFSAGSIRRALDAGLAGADLLERLRAASRTPLPQALEYLITDAARRHGQVRVGSAVSYVRVLDPVAAASLAGHPELVGVGLRAIAPTVLVSSARPAELLELLRLAGAAPVLEGPDGAVITARPGAGAASGRSVDGDVGRGRRTAGTTGRAVRRPIGRLPGTPEAAPVGVRHLDDADLADVVSEMRAGQTRAAEAAERRLSGEVVATDPVHTVALLREAARTGSAVSVVVVGPNGGLQRRRVRPLSIEGGRFRMADLDRDAEIVVAIHRINAVGEVPES